MIDAHWLLVSLLLLAVVVIAKNVMLVQLL
jgi:hypothetical protein